MIEYHCKVNMLSIGLGPSDGDDITYSSLTMRALQWSYDSLRSGLRNVALLSYLFCFPKHLTNNIRIWHI